MRTTRSTATGADRPETGRGARSVTLIDPFSTGHHTPYAVMLCQQLHARGLEVNLIGPAELVRSVRDQAPGTRTAVLELYQGSRAEYYHRGVFPFQRLWREERSSYLFIRRALKLAADWESEIVHFVFLDSFILSLLAALPPRTEMRVYTTLHWAYLLPRFSSPGRIGRAKAAAQMWALRQLLRRGVRLQVHTASFASEIGRRTFPQQVHYLPYPVTEPGQTCWDEVEALRSELGVAPDVKLLLAFGGTRRNKGADIAVAALAHLPEQYHLMIVGAEEDFSARTLTELAQQVGAAQRLHLRMEYLTQEQYEPYFAASAAAVLPYRQDFSGQSGVMFIAGAMGVPVVASDAGTTSELIGQFGLGRVFSNTSSTSRVSETVAERMAQAVRVAVEQPEEQAVRRRRQAHLQQTHSVNSFIDALIRDYTTPDMTAVQPRHLVRT